MSRCLTWLTSGWGRQYALQAVLEPVHAWLDGGLTMRACAKLADEHSHAAAAAVLEPGLQKRNAGLPDLGDSLCKAPRDQQAGLLLAAHRSAGSLSCSCVGCEEGDRLISASRSC